VGSFSARRRAFFAELPIFSFKVVCLLFLFCVPFALRSLSFSPEFGYLLHGPPADRDRSNKAVFLSLFFAPIGHLPPLFPVDEEMYFFESVTPFFLLLRTVDIPFLLPSISLQLE